ncbi:MAG: glycosyltransferase 87 family protein, partial [Acidobacteriota bacterium]
MALTPEPAAPPAAPARVRPALAAGVILILAAALFAPKVSRKMPDLEVYWKAAVRARAAEPLYRVEDQHYQFKYLPAFAVLAVPGGALPLHTAKAAWYVISIALVVALLALSPSLLPERRRPAWLLVAAALVAMAKFLAHEVVLGQVNTLLAVLVVAAVLAMRRSKEAAAGLLIALAIVVKPYAVIFLPWLLARRRWTAAAAAGVSLGG